jgi:hypothetical protein
MAIDYDKLMNWDFPETRQDIKPKDVMLYALGIGLGADPVDPDELKFVYEKDLVAMPSMASVLGYPGNWLRNPDSGVNYLKLVNAGNAFTIHNPIPVEGTMVGQAKVESIIDKGEGRGALISSSRDVVHKETDTLICTIRASTYCRADGGFGGPSGPVPEPQPVPDTAPALTCDLATVPQSALIYRLSGDYNPLHADPETAKKAGFDRPIAHGLLRLRPAPVQGHGGPLLGAGLPGRDDPHRNVARRRYRHLPRHHPGPRQHRRAQQRQGGDSVTNTLVAPSCHTTPPC